MIDTRSPAVAGLFYINDPEDLRSQITTFLSEVPPEISSLPVPKAIVAPHAGYIYSGSVAASAYACLSQNQNNISRVVLLGPAHRYPVLGIALSSAKFFETPLGTIPVDHTMDKTILAYPQTAVLDEAHVEEHSLEVQLPFLQYTLDKFSIIPLLIGQMDPDQLAEILESVWGGEETLIVVSSDLSHYFFYTEAQQRDRATCDAILSLNANRLKYDDACGLIPLQGLLIVASRKGLKPQELDLRNSGDTAGPKDQVVGYGAFHFREGNT